MRRIDAKRILLTITLLLALSLTAGMFLHNHGEPEIIGELEPGDASEISKVTLDFDRAWTRDLMRTDLKNGKFLALARLIYHYPLLRVKSIEAIDSDDAVVRLGVGNKKQLEYVLEKEGDSWNVTSVAAK